MGIIFSSGKSENGFNIYECVFGSTVGQYFFGYPNLDTADFARVISAGQAFGYANGGATIRNFSFSEQGIVSHTLAGNNEFATQFGFGASSALSSAVSSSPTFFVLEAGFEDMMSFAQEGAEGDAEIGDASLAQMEIYLQVLLSKS